MTYKGCKIYRWQGGNNLVWECTLYGAESELFFNTVDEAKADIDRYFGNGSTPKLINNEIYA